MLKDHGLFEGGDRGEALGAMTRGSSVASMRMAGGGRERSGRPSARAAR